jgi:hypothetical protein
MAERATRRRMRTVYIAACASALLVATGTLGAGCISSSSTAPDAGSGDSGAFDAGGPSDGGSPALVDASDAARSDASATLSSATVDFGLVGCGSAGASQTYSFTNTGPVPVTYSASISGASVFSIDGASSGSVAPGASASMTIVTTTIPVTSVAGTPLTGALTVTTNVPGFTTVTVPLSVTPQGGSLTVSPALAGFGQVQLATNGTPIPLTIANVGNAPVSITIGTPAEPDGGATDSEFGVAYPGSPSSVTIPAGGTIGADAGVTATFAPLTAGLKSVAAAIQTSDPLCASAATSIAMSGTGTAAQVSVGPDPLPFGTTLCGQTGTKLTVTVTNSSPAAVSFTDALTLGASSPYTISIANGSVPGGALANPGKTTIDVTPKKITTPASVVAGAFNDTLVVTPSAPGVAPTTISLQESAAGAILAVTMGTTGFGTVQNTSSSLPFTVKNTGNRDAPLVLTPGGTGYTASFTASSTATANGGTAAGNVTFVPSSNGADNGSLTVTTTEALCTATPAAVQVTATGAVPVAQYASGTIAIGSTCGGGAGTTGSLTVTNNGQSPLTVSNVASANGHFTFTTPGSIAPGSKGAIGITASAIAVGSGPTGGSTLSDTLSFTTNEVGSPTHQVDVTVAVSGANLKFSTGNTATLTTCGSTNYSVTNTGNLDGYITAGGTYPIDADSANDPTMFEFKAATFQSSTLIPTGGALVTDTLDHDTGICAFGGICTYSGTQTFTSTNASGTQVGICVPLPTLDMSIDFGFNCNQCC